VTNPNPRKNKMAAVIHAVLGGYAFAIIVMIGYFMWRTSGPNSSSITSWRVLYCVVVFSVYSACMSWFQWGPLATIALIPVPVIIIFFAIRIRIGTPASHNGAVTGKRFQLVTLVGSHYSEKVRWCLDLLDAPYEECVVGGFLPSLFRGRSVPWLKDRNSESHIGNSDEILMYVGAVYVPSIFDPCLREKAKLLMRRDATTISWESRLVKVAVAIQGWGYSQLLKTDPTGIISKHVWGVFCPRVTALERMILDVGYPLWKALIRDAKGFLDLSNTALQDQRYQALLSVLKDVDNALGRTGDEGFLTGPHPSYIDVAFCALAAPLMPGSVSIRKPSFWAGGKFPQTYEQAKARGWVRSAVQSKLEQELLQRPCGQFIVRMYKQRNKPLHSVI